MDSSAWKIRVRPKADDWVELKLPVLIGSSALADIVVHSPAVAGRAKLLTAKDGRLWCWDIGREAWLDDHGLQAYGINVVGPYMSNKSRVRWLQTLIQKEERWHQALSPSIKGLLGLHMDRMQRWVCYGLIALGIILAVFGMLRPSAVQVPDESRTPMVMKYGQIATMAYGLTGTYQGLRHGVSFSYPIPTTARGHDHAFEIQVGMIDKPKELELVVGGRKLFTTTVRPECLDNLCSESILIPAEFTKAPSITLTLVHRNSNSDYLVTNILFDRLRPLSDQERIAVERGFGFAQRHFDERAISYQNLISSKKQIKRVLAMLQLRSGADAIRDQAQALDRDLEQEIAIQTEDMWFQSRRSIMLGDYRDALNRLKGLLEFYPDPEHPRSIQITEAIKSLEEIL